MTSEAKRSAHGVLGSFLYICARVPARTRYALVRFSKPQRVLEVGAGYTSLFLLQALQDNVDEVAALRSRATHAAFAPVKPLVAASLKESNGEDAITTTTLRGLATFTPQQVPWNVPGSLEGDASALVAPSGSSSSSSATAAEGGCDDSGGVRRCGGTPRLDVVDNMAHGHTTANLVAAGADRLGLRPLLRIHQVSPFSMCRPEQRRLPRRFSLLTRLRRMTCFVWCMAGGCLLRQVDAFAFAKHTTAFQFELLGDAAPSNFDMVWVSNKKRKWQISNHYFEI